MTIKLRIVQGRPAGKSMLFPRGEYVFGRGTECHIRPNSDWVSRQHCLLRITAEGAFLRDLGSRNGTLINGTRLVDECQLEHGDQVQVGPLVFEVVLEESVSESATPAEAPARTADARDTAAMQTVDTAELEAMQGATRPTPADSPADTPTADEMPALKKS
jgi:pSer/pThr/pTyr-binding forkhead associated (FHA) protein